MANVEIAGEASQTPESELDLLVKGELPEAAGNLALQGYVDFFFEECEPEVAFGD